MELETLRQFGDMLRHAWWNCKHEANRELLHQLEMAIKHFADQKQRDDAPKAPGEDATGSVRVVR